MKSNSRIEQAIKAAKEIDELISEVHRVSTNYRNIGYDFPAELNAAQVSLGRARASVRKRIGELVADANK